MHTSRRTFLSTTGLATAYLAATPLQAVAATIPRRKFSVSLLCAAPAVFDYLSWRLWDPLVLAVGIPEIRAVSAATCDLLILGERLPDESPRGRTGQTSPTFADFLAGLPGAQGVIAVQPGLLGESLRDDVGRRFGVEYQNWRPETPRRSDATNHALNEVLRQLGRRTDNAHIAFDWHLQVTAPAASAVTRLTSGSPDIVVQDRACFIATNLFADLVAHGRHPDYRGYEATLSALLANLIRAALGAKPAAAPRGEDYHEARLAFYGYAFARKFILEVQSLKGAERSVGDRLGAADQLVAAAAESLLAGEAGSMRRLLREAGEQLIAARKVLTPVQPYFVRGWHGGLLSDHKAGGEIVGYAEWGWPSFSMRWAEQRLHAAEQLDTKQVNQVCGNTWDVIADYEITDLKRWQKASAAGLVETVKGMYSDAYLEVLGTESNLRQFEFGLKALARMGGTVRTFAIAYDDFAFHPQLPQLLRGFGFERAVLRCGNPGVVAGIDQEAVVWQGLDGTLIPAVPKYRTVPVAGMGSNLSGGSGGGINAMARTLVAAAKAGFRTVLAGGIQDHTMTMHGECEWEAFNALAPVQAVPTTFADYFASVSPDPEPRFYGADDLLGRPFAWSGFGSLNQMAREDRHLERLLVTAEKFSTLAAFVGRPYPAKQFEKAWKNLLSSQDHFAYGCGGAENPEGYHVGGLEEPFIPDYPGPRTPITTEATSHEWKTSAEEIARQALDGALVDLLRRESRPGPGEAQQVVVYNACNWDRQGEVQCWIPAPAPRELSLHDGERDWPAAVLDWRKDGDAERALISFQASAPSLGFRAYSIRPRGAIVAQPDRRTDAPPVLENRHLRATFHSETGGITSIVEKSRGAELLRSGQQARFLCANPGVDSSAARARVETGRADVVAGSVLISGKLANSTYRLRVSLARESPILEVDLEIDYGRGAIFGFKGQPGTLLRQVFPFAASKTRWVNLPFGVYETKTASPVALDFLDLSFGDHGVALINDGVPGLHTPGDDVAVLISDGFPPLRGVHRYRYGIYPHRGDWRSARVPWHAWEFQQPLATQSLDRAHLPLPFSRSYLRTTADAVLSGLHLHEGKPRARFYDAAGTARAIEANWHFPWEDPATTELDGRQPRPAHRQGAIVRFDLPAWGIVTLGDATGKGGRP